MTLATLITLLYIILLIALTLFVLSLISRFVSAHERMADALTSIARKFGKDPTP